MRLAEVFLRIGCSLVGWMILVAYVLWLAVAGHAACDGDPVELYRLLLFAAPIASVLTLMIRLTHPLPEIHQMMRWIGIFPALFVPNATMTIIAAFRAAYVSATGPCGIGSAPTWFGAWPIVQAIALLACLAIVVFNWRPARA